MKSKITFLLFILFSINSFAQIINVSTGVDNSGNALIGGTSDPNWQVVSSPYPNGTPAFTTSFNGIWESVPTTTTNASWINATGSCCNINTPGNYTFERTFTVGIEVININYNFKIAFDDELILFELVKPDGNVIPLSIAPNNPVYLFSSTEQGTISNTMAGIWKIRAKINLIDAHGAFLLSGTVSLDTNLAITENGLNNKIQIYPNPTTDFINISSKEKINTAEIYDINGRMLLKTNKIDDEISLENLNSGIYLILLQLENGKTEIQKIIKK